MSTPYRIWKNNAFEVCNEQQFFEFYKKDLPTYTFSDGEEAVGSFNDMAQRAGFDFESAMFDLNVYTKGDIYLFTFENCEHWIAIRVEGLLDYLHFIKEWANPYVQYQRVVYKNN